MKCFSSWVHGCVKSDVNCFQYRNGVVEPQNLLLTVAVSKNIVLLVFGAHCCCVQEHKCYSSFVLTSANPQMPKERKDRSLSSDRSRASPYPCSSNGSLRSLSESSSEDIKEWEEARCPVCMEHPHNAVLLLCTSHDKGCRPYMCDTSYRHSNCLDQFRKSFAQGPSTVPGQEEAPQSSLIPPMMNSEPTRTDLLEERNEDWSLHTQATTPTAFCENSVKPNLLCPLCRGQINGWIVVEPARWFMNSKARSCACETCDYSGTYADLRNHARVEHPFVRPSEADPERQNAWRRLERERDLGDVLSTMQSAFMEEGGADHIFATEEGSLLTVFFLFRVLRPPGTGSGATMNRWPSFSRSRVQSSVSRSRWQSRRQRRRLTLWGESYDSDTGFPAVEDENESSESGLASQHQNEQNRR